MSIFTVKFRDNEIDVKIVRNGGYEFDTGAHEIEWEFVGLTLDEIESLKINDDEYQSIDDQVHEVLNDPYYYDDSDLF